MVNKKKIVVADENTEKRILSAAKKVIFSKGYAGAKMQDIADEAGINKALLHYYFRSKDKLFEMIFKEATGKLTPQVSFIFSDPELDIFGKIRAFCHSYIGTWMEHPYVPMFVLHELHSNPEKGIAHLFDKEKFKPIREQVLGAFTDAVKKKQIRPVDPYHIFLNLISLCLFPFMGRPVFMAVTGISQKQFDLMMQQRAGEVSEFIIESIKYRK